MNQLTQKRIDMTKAEYIKKLVVEDKKRLEEKLEKVKRMDEGDAQTTLLAKIQEEIKLNDSMT